VLKSRGEKKTKIRIVSTSRVVALTNTTNACALRFAQCTNAEKQDAVPHWGDCY